MEDANESNLPKIIIPWKRGELPNKFKYLKRFAEDDSVAEEEEAERKRRRNHGLPRIVNVATFTAFVAIGAVFHEQCGGNRAALFLIIAGVMQVLGSLLKGASI